MCSCVVALAWCSCVLWCARVVDLSCVLVWRPSHVFACGGPGMVFSCGSHSGVFGGRHGAIRGHSGVRGHVVSRQGPLELGGQSGNRGYAPDTHTMYVYLIAHSLQPIPHTRCPMSPYHILDAHCLIPDTLTPLCPIAHTRYWFLFHGSVLDILIRLG